MRGKSTNLQFTRFGAAVLVIFSHSFILTQGDMGNEWLYKYTNGQMNLGAFAVALFFLCGGYLCIKSLEQYDTFKAFLLSRCLRILPSLITVVVACVLIGSFFSELSYVEYFSRKETYLYLMNGFFVLQHELPGVFVNAVYCPTVNGALWTMPVEFLCNMVCYPAKKIKALEKKVLIWTLPIMCVFMAVVLYLGFRIPIVLSVFRPCILFYIGMLYYTYRELIPLKKNIAIGMLFAFILLTFLGMINIAMFICLPYFAITFWFGGKQLFEKISILGQFSYCMYLWGFPIQQAVGQLFEWKMSFWMNFAISLPIDILFGVVTFYFVEKPLGQKGKVKKSILR